MIEENLSLEEIDTKIEQINARLKSLEEQKGRLGFSFAASVTFNRIEELQRDARRELSRLENIKKKKLAEKKESDAKDKEEAGGEKESAEAEAMGQQG